MRDINELSLGSLIKSRGGHHLTIYIKNWGDPSHLRIQLTEAYEQALEHLAPVIEKNKLVNFLKPIKSLMRNPDFLMKFKGNIGIFRNSSGCRVLRVPTEVEFTCIVATTFHVKPLLKWAQNERGFFLMGTHGNCIHLYTGGRSQITYVDSYSFDPDSFESTLDESIFEIHFDMRRQSQSSGLPNQQDLGTKIWNFSTATRIYFAGSFEQFTRIQKQLGGTLRNLIWIDQEFTPSRLGELYSNIKKRIEQEVSETIELSLIEYMDAELIKMGRKNIFQISKAVREGRVKKLIVADGINIFGKRDRVSGGLALHPADLDHEDDDLLDDLAQEVLLQGGEVVVAPKEKIPNGRPILAILDSSPVHLKLKRQTSRKGEEIYGSSQI